MIHVLALLQAAAQATAPAVNATPAVPPQSMVVFMTATIIKMLVVFTIYLVGVALLTLAERKVSAWMQDRHGPNRVGKGWLQPAADGLKNIMKDDITILKIDVDKNPHVANAFQIQGVPTLIIFKDGQIKWRQSGVATAKQLQQVLQHLPQG